MASPLRDVRVVADHQERPCGHGAGHVSPRVRRGLLRVLLAAVHQGHHAVRRLREGLKGKLKWFFIDVSIFCLDGDASPAVSSLVVHKRFWSSKYVSNCIFTLRKWLTNVIGAPQTFVDDQ